MKGIFKKVFRSVVCATLCAALIAPAVACGGGGDPEPAGKKYDSEVRPVVFAIGSLDQKFNPFFSTSANDSVIAGMTQISMLSVARNGEEPAVGPYEPCVTLDYSVKMFRENGTETEDASAADYTEYEFVIKNGIKFSDGVDLTIKDVLFNLYAYLDPAYTGSSTIYSTDIRGLKQYREQDPTLTDESEVDSSATFYATANARRLAIIEFIEEFNEDQDSVSPEKYQQIQADIATVKELFREEITSDWNNNAGGLESYKDYGFTEDWQSYYYNEQIIVDQYKQNQNGAYERTKKPALDANGEQLKDKDGNDMFYYVTSLDDETSVLQEEIESYVEENLAAYKTAHPEADDAYAREQLIKEKAIDTVYETYCGNNQKIPDIITYWGTSGTVLEKFAQEARTEYFKTKKTEGKLAVESISGITTRRTTTFNGKNLEEEHDVLKVTINKIDPKAIWNFGFTVTPMHYYSNAEQTEKAMNGEGFGVEFGDVTFFDRVLADEDKTGVPVGAGVYKAASDNKNVFFSSNVVHYVRNEFFYTVGIDCPAAYKKSDETAITNAKIKYLNYQVTRDDSLMNALKSGAVDFGDPAATPDNVNELGNYSYLSYKKIKTAGYGYVGINPKYVPDLAVRQAIMKALNSSLIIKNYYTKDLGEVIYRPMSSTSWAYPVGAREYDSVKYTTSKKDITDLVESAGWIKNPTTGIYEKNGKRLKFTFTIAGESTDHPAYSMFVNAKTFLETCGFEITVKTDIQALKKLATGGLEVWAAAWSSGVDPDMYQVYHKDSTASSVKNWGYDVILSDTTGVYDYEKAKIEELSEAIEFARETLNKNDRIERYATCLDLVMDLAVEFPTYQRYDLSIFNNTVIDVKTLNSDPNQYEGLTHKLWEVDYL